MKRLLMTTDAVGGIWDFSLQLAESVGDYGLEVALVTMGPLPSESQKREVQRVPNITFYESTYRLEWMEDPWEDIAQAGKWLLELEQQLQPDLVHLNGYVHGALNWEAPVCLVGHSCVISWWNAVHHEPTPQSWSKYRLAVQKGIQHCDFLVAPSLSMLKMLERWYGQAPASSVIYNGRSSQRFRPERKEPIVFSAGRVWDAAKNMGALIRCAGDLPWQFVMAGEGGSEIALPSNFRALGKVPSNQIAKEMARASIYCLPARYEPFGLSVLEAALAGCALILSDIDSFRELWSGAALFVPPDDDRRLKQVLNDLITDDRLRENLARAAWERAQKYSLETMVSSYLRLYEHLQRSGKHQEDLEAVCR
jgi:glycogen synthase